MSKLKYNEGDLVTFTEKTPIWFKRYYHSAIEGTIIKKEGSTYVIKINNGDIDTVKFPSTYIKKKQKLWRFKS